MTSDDLTFGLAVVGYALLAADFALEHRGRPLRGVGWSALGVVSAHVVCVWALRFHWSLQRMLDKSLAGFLLFHGALLLIVAARLAEGTRRRAITSAAFVLVTAGAVPAPLRYPELSLLTLPVFAIASIAIALAFAAHLGRRRSNGRATGTAGAGGSAPRASRRP